MYFTYILVSGRDNSYYIGSTNNIERRRTEHNAGNNKYTANKGPWRVFYTEEYASRSEALRREMQIKSWEKRSMIERLVG